MMIFFSKSLQVVSFVSPTVSSFKKRNCRSYLPVHFYYHASPFKIKLYFCIEKVKHIFT